jgi:hypothetical protein
MSAFTQTVQGRPDCSRATESAGMIPPGCRARATSSLFRTGCAALPVVDETEDRGTPA